MPGRACQFAVWAPPSFLLPLLFPVPTTNIHLPLGLSLTPSLSLSFVFVHCCVRLVDSLASLSNRLLFLAESVEIHQPCRHLHSRASSRLASRHSLPCLVLSRVPKTYCGIYIYKTASACLLALVQSSYVAALVPCRHLNACGWTRWLSPGPEETKRKAKKNNEESDRSGDGAATMGLFKRKDSKHSIHSDRDDQDNHSSHSTRTSTASLKSPGIVSSTTLPASIPEVPISKPPDPSLDPAAYLRSIHAVRERSRIVLQKARKNQLTHFDVDMSKFEATASYVVSIIKV